MPMPITVVDRLGFDSHYYRTLTGESLFSPERFDVRLVTSLKKLPNAVGDSLQSVLGIRSFDEQTLKHAARIQSEFASVRSERLVVLTERMLLPGARLREALDLPGDWEHDVLPFRDKVAMKELLSNSGVKVPRFAPYSASAALDLLRETGTIVIKPRREAGAKDVNIISDAHDIADFEARFYGRLDEFEVEEYIDGQIHHMDSVVRDSRVIAVTVSKSLDAPTVFKDGTHYHDVEVEPGETRDVLVAFNEKVIKSYPNFTGVTHHEVFLTAGNEVCFLEIAGRWGGGGIRAGFRFRTGVDLVAAMLAAQVGDPVPDSVQWSDDLTGYAMIYVSEKTLKRDVILDEPWVVENYVRVKQGEALPRPVSWEQAAAVVTVSGKDASQVAERLGIAEAAVLRAFT